MIRARRPWAAALLSLALAGLGHLYGGYPRTALLAYGLNLCAPAVLLASWLLLPAAPWNILLGLLAFPLLGLATSVHAAVLARRRSPDYRLRGYNRWYVYLGLYVALGVLLSTAVQNWVRQDVEAFRIPSGAMAPTLRIGDFLFAAKWPGARAVSHGCVVVFESVDEPGLKQVKRVMGLPGDTVAMRRGVLYRNRLRMAEPYLPADTGVRSENGDQRAVMRGWQVAHVVGGDTADYAPDLNDWGPLVVPGDSLFVLGDSRQESYDSRYYGFVPVDNVIGRPVVIYWSFDPQAAGPAIANVRWGRIGTRP